MAKPYQVRRIYITVEEDDIDTEDYVTLIENSPLKKYINTCLVESIQHANKNKRKFAKFVELGTTRIVLQIEKNNWIPALQNLISAYEKEEDYEQCTRIQSLINSIT